MTDWQPPTQDAPPPPLPASDPTPRLSRDELAHIVASAIERQVNSRTLGPSGRALLADVAVDALHEAGALPMGEPT